GGCIEIEGEWGGKRIGVEVHEARPRHFDFEADFAASGLNRIVVYGGGGNNVVLVSRGVSVPVLAFDGTARDSLLSVSLPTLLVGGDGAGALARLASLLAQWSGIDLAAALRTGHLPGLGAGGCNDSYFLNSALGNAL